MARLKRRKNPKPFVLIGAGDIADFRRTINPPWDAMRAEFKKTAAYRTSQIVINELRKNARSHCRIFTLGDNCYYTGANMDLYDLTWGRPIDRGRTLRELTFPIIGDHDRVRQDGSFGDPVGDPTSPEAESKINYFYFRDHVEEGDPGFTHNDYTRAHYMRDLSHYDRGCPWALLMLDSTFYSDVNGQFNSPNNPSLMYSARYDDQKKWLIDVLSRLDRDNKSIIAMWHHPLYYGLKFNRDSFPLDNARDQYASERYNKMMEIWELLVGRASLVLTGHEHWFLETYPMDKNLMRDDKNGLTQLVVGTGGSFPSDIGMVRTVDDYQPQYIWKNYRTNIYGVVVLKLYPGEHKSPPYGEWEFIQVPADKFHLATEPAETLFRGRFLGRHRNKKKERDF